ncbi:MAG: WS/DGAT/MGAT family O-acyltransferase [Candidatus Nanopelagicales bacterium]
MPDRLSSLDVSYLYMEQPTTPMHVGSVAIFAQPPSGFDYERLVALIRARIVEVPRFRQRVRWVPGRLANPVWVDDKRFDVTYHVRRSALPRPGGAEQLNDLVARLMSRPLDRARPLWEMYLVEGLSEGRFAIISKTHHAMVDGATAIDIGQVILEDSPRIMTAKPEPWKPRREPTSAELVAAATAELVSSPKAVVADLREGVADVSQTVTRLGGQLAGVLSAARTMAHPPASSPLNLEIGSGRRFATVTARLSVMKEIKAEHGGTINDVLLTVLAGGLRSWLLKRGGPVSHNASLRALVPVSVRPAGAGQVSGNHVAAFLCDLPIGEPDPLARLHRVSLEMETLKDTGQMLGATALVGVASFTPPTLHALGARAVAGLSRRVYNLVVTNVPGPQFPLYAAGAELLAAYPVVPLAPGQAVSMGLTSYNGGVFIGIYADWDALPDIADLAQCIDDALAELASLPVRAQA